MDRAYLSALAEKLEIWGARLTPGLDEAELVSIEERYGFRFPPDLRAFLAFMLPTSPGPPGRGWLDWRSWPEMAIRERLEWPAEGICWDVEHDDFWMERWGPRPPDLVQALEVARAEVAAAPRLIPICSHRYLPAEPCLAGNPVFSVYQTDIIRYGNDLAGYFAAEFHADPDVLPQYHVPVPEWAAREPRPIRFWDDFL